MALKRSTVFDFANVAFLAILGFVVAYPFLYTVSISISNPRAVALGEVLLLPKGLDVTGYRQVIQSPRIWMSYKNTVLYSAVGTVVRVLLLMITSYPLSRAKFPGRTFFTFLIGFTMLFGGGLVPTFLVVRGLGLIDTIWAIVIPGALSAYNIIIVRTFFQTTIHPSLEESAMLDGANDLHILIRVVLPLSAPIVAVMSLFTAVGIWNDYFTPMLYLKSDWKYPLTMILRDIVIMAQGREFLGLQELQFQRIPPQSVQAATLIISMIPIMLVYPFIQKYFVKGIMIGAIKG
jgi:ABC-type glycerol-3-phosphate transport system permease component